MNIALFTDRWALKAPFATSRETVSHIDTLRVELQADGCRGRSEALGVDYHAENPQTMREQIEAVREELEAGFDHEGLLELLPAGGARNALDCALWDLRARQTGQRVWQLLGREVAPLTTVYTISLASLDDMVEQARQSATLPALKIKLDEDQADAKIRAIRAACPHAELVIDANGAWTGTLLDQLADTLRACRVAMVEQPLPAGEDDALDGLAYPVTLCADESCQDSGDLEAVTRRYSMVNIKLDKSGGLTEALRMVEWCRAHDMAFMVGNMLGSSLAMAPAFIAAQGARFVDLDGPLWQREDHRPAMRFDNGTVYAPETELWG